MLGEKIDTTKAKPELIKELAGQLLNQAEQRPGHPLAVAIAGESGSGKTVIAHALQEYLLGRGKMILLLQMDDYFILPPRANSARRQESLDNVGMGEVDLVQLDQNLLDIKAGDPQILKPLVDFHNSTKIEIQWDVPTKLDYVFVEGTYVTALNNVDLRIFISRSYQDTHVHRVARQREPQTELIEKVLEIEHQIIQTHKSQADVVISKFFEIEKNS